MGIAWKTEYETGIAQIDAQHRQLFRMVDSLGRIIDAGIEKGPEVDHLLMFFGSYAKSHFAYEEPCMARHRCPAAKKNKQAHRDFLMFYESLQEEYALGENPGGHLIRLKNYLSDWLVDHICKVDAQLKPCVRGATTVEDSGL